MAKWVKSDKICKSIITQLISDSHLQYIKDKETAHEMWKSLINNFERKGMANQLLLRKRLLMMKFQNTAKMENHFTEFDKLIRELKSTGATLEETDVVCHLLLTMPSQYNMLVTALETISPENLTLSFVKARLKEEESKKKSTRVNKAETQPWLLQRRMESLETEMENRCHGRVTTRNFLTGATHNCRKIGHKRVDCRKPSMDPSKTANVVQTEEEQIEYSFSALDEALDTNLHWWLDSGALEHMIKNKTGLHNIRKLEKVIKIKVAKSGELLIANKIGDLRVLSSHSTSWGSSSDNHRGIKLLEFISSYNLEITQLRHGSNLCQCTKPGRYRHHVGLT